MKQTAVEWFYDKIKTHFEHDGDLLETLIFTKAIAKEKEKQQHGETWDASIENYKSRGGNEMRAWADFDDHYNEKYS